MNRIIIIGGIVLGLGGLAIVGLFIAARIAGAKSVSQEGIFRSRSHQFRTGPYRQPA